MDMEKQTRSKAVDNTDEVEKIRVGGLLSMFSALLVVEGVIRFVSSDPSRDLDLLTSDDGQYPPVILALGGTFETTFGATGLIAGLLVLVFDVHSPSFTFLSLILQFVLGWFVFISYNVAEPIFNHRNNLPLPVFPAGQLSDSEQKAALTFGYIFGSVAYCGCIQGFQFFAALKLWRLQTGKEDPPSAKKGRAIGYGVLAFLGGMSSLVLGCIVAGVDGGELTPEDGTFFVYPPNIVTYSSLTILSGLALLIHSFVVLASPFVEQARAIVLPVALGVWIYLITAHVMTQISLAGPGFAAPAAQIALLATAVVWAPAIFAHQSA